MVRRKSPGAGYAEEVREAAAILAESKRLHNLTVGLVTRLCERVTEQADYIERLENQVKVMTEIELLRKNKVGAAT